MFEFCPTWLHCWSSLDFGLDLCLAFCPFSHLWLSYQTKIYHAYGIAPWHVQPTKNRKNQLLIPHKKYASWSSSTCQKQCVHDTTSCSGCLFVALPRPVAPLLLSLVVFLQLPFSDCRFQLHLLLVVCFFWFLFRLERSI